MDQDMTRVVSFRPGVAEAKSAFEAMADIYRYLEDRYGYDFTILVGEDDTFRDDQLTVRTIPDAAWQPLVTKLPVYPPRLSYRRYVDPVFEKADLVLTVDPTAYQQGALGIKRASKTETPVWFDSSATLNGDFEPLQLLRRPFELARLRETDRVLSTVPKNIERFRDRQLYDESTAESFEVLGHPVDTDRFAPGPSDKGETDVILAVSRIVPEKGLFYVLNAVAPLLKSNGSVEFQVLGDGTMRHQLERKAARLGIEDNVSFLGTVPHEEVPSVLRNADVFVNHAVANSHWEEFFGVANLEAMACGVPPVVSDCGGVTYSIREPDVAKIVGQRNIVAIREAIEQLLDDPDTRKQMGERAREYVLKHYSLERIGDRYHELVQQTVTGSARPE
jgi:glycosyltransferase involved in cell wall biosynthesis